MTDEERKELNETLNLVYDALKSHGYDAIPQIAGYLSTGDPTYITTYDNARKTISSVDRDDLLIELLTAYFS